MDKLAVNIGSKFNSSLGRTVSLGEIVTNFVDAAIVLAGTIMVFLFVFGGISMIAGAGQGNAESAARGRKALTAALVGFMIIFGSYWILRIIEIMTGYNFVTQPSF